VAAQAEDFSELLAVFVVAVSLINRWVVVWDDGLEKILQTLLHHAQQFSWAQ
jgi:hypothetical protein